MKRLLLLIVILMGNCRVLIPREHLESTAIWNGNTQLVEALSRYQARLSWYPLSQEMIAGPAMTEILVYSMQPASLSLPEPKRIGKSPGRIHPTGLAISKASIYYLVEENDRQTLYVMDMNGGQPRPLLSGEILAIGASDQLLAVFGSLSGRTVVWVSALDGGGRPIAKLERSQEIPGSLSTPLFRIMQGRLYVKSGESVYLFDAQGDRRKAETFPACFYAVDAGRGLSPDGRLFSRSAEGEAKVIQSEPFKPDMRMTDRFDETGC